MSDERREKNNEQKDKDKKVLNDDLELTADEEKALKKKIAELRKRDPFIYR